MKPHVPGSGWLIALAALAGIGATVGVAIDAAVGSRGFDAARAETQYSAGYKKAITVRAHVEYDFVYVNHYDDALQGARVTTVRYRLSLYTSGVPYWSRLDVHSEDSPATVTYLKYGTNDLACSDDLQKIMDQPPRTGAACIGFDDVKSGVVYGTRFFSLFRRYFVVVYDDVFRYVRIERAREEQIAGRRANCYRFVPEPSEPANALHVTEECLTGDGVLLRKRIAGDGATYTLTAKRLSDVRETDFQPPYEIIATY